MIRRRLLLASALALLVGTGCTGLPDKVQPVSGFELNRYLGTWYEIARLDHSFERGLSQVSAQYSLREDGGVRVINRGFDAAKGSWKEAQGKARFVGAADVGHLKVSFFGPFYGSYVVFDLDRQGYQHAFVSGPDTDYLWLLSRTPTVSPALKERFETMARERGFDTQQLVWVNHSPAGGDAAPKVQ
jgi:apolipoprotein D and lipocalin family protein